MKRITLVVTFVIAAAVLTSDAQAAPSTLDWRGTFGNAHCNYSETWVCRGTSWSSDLATGAFDAGAAIDGPNRFRINRDHPYGAQATATLRRTYGLAQPVSAVRINVEVTLTFEDEPAVRIPDVRVGGSGANSVEFMRVSATHADAASAGVSCSMPPVGWHRDDWVNPYQDPPAPGTVFTSQMTCRDVNAQPVAVPPGRIRIDFIVFAGVGGGNCRASAIVTNDCVFAIPDYDSGSSRLRGVARLSVET